MSGLVGASFEISKSPEGLPLGQPSGPIGLIWIVVKVLGIHTEYQEQLAESWRAPYCT